MKRLALAFLTAAALSIDLHGQAPLAPVVDAVLSPGGKVRFDAGDGRDRVLAPMAFMKGWTAARPSGGYEVEKPGKVSMGLKSDGRRVLDVAVSLLPLEGGRARLDCAFAALEDIELCSVGLAMELDASDVSGRQWSAGDASGAFERRADGGIHLANGASRSFELELGASGASVRIESEEPFGYLVQDNSKWGDAFVVRLGALSPARLGKGESIRLSLDLSVPGGMLGAGCAGPYVVEPGGDWIPLEVRRDIEPGSALDFSGMGFADAPAGKHGWLRAVGDHFEFEGLPGVVQRLCGVNLCFSANYPDHELAETLAVRFRRLGYNAVRIHHHDAMWAESEENRERLDWFLAKCFENGLYATTDLYVSRGRATPWRDIGVDRDGTVNDHLFKLLFAVWDPAFENWAENARAFLMHENPYTGRRYVDEPGMPLLSLVNKGGFFVGWYRGDGRDDPRVIASWKSWLEGKRRADPAFAPGLSADQTPRTFHERDVPPAVAQWTGELEARMFSRMKARLRAMGCRALLSNDNCGPHYAALQKATAGYDYIDDHFYIDHPSYPEVAWRLPAACRNENPIRGTEPLLPSPQAFTRMLDKPFTVTEWNYVDPAECRGVGGFLAGSMAALQGWAGLWRFAYSHTRAGLGDREIDAPHFFDLAADPLAQAAERAVMCLFLRGDLAPFGPGVALWVTDESAAAMDKTYMGAPPWCDEAWRMRAGSCLSPEAAGGLRVLRREEADPAPGASAPGPADLRETPLSIDRRSGTLSVSTPRTCGGFAESGRIDAGPLSFEIGAGPPVPTTLWASSLDGRPIASSSRLLLTHLTDVQGEGSKFADARRQVLLERGTRPLVCAGSAAVELRLDAASAPDAPTLEVFALDSSGHRIAAIPAAYDPATGVLRFTASTRGPDGQGVLCYEIAR